MLQSLSKNAGFGGADIGPIGKAVRELQGLRTAVLTGVAANTKMAVAAMRAEDTILAALIVGAVAADFVDDTANVTMSAAQATGTITISGNPVADETVTVNGAVYTFKATPSDIRHVKITAGNNTAMALALANAINNYENRRYGGGWNPPAVVATAALGVVTLTCPTEGVDGNAITLTEAATNVAVSGATLAGGSAVGGIQTPTVTTGKKVLLFWYDKNP